MKTKAVRLHGKNDLRLDRFELDAVGNDGILAKVVTDSVCMSTYKAAIQGEKHKRVPENIAEIPVIMGHEFAGEIIEVGEKWTGQFRPGDRFSIQPNINYLGKGYAPGYSFSDFGGNATYIRIPGVVMEKGCLLPYDGREYYKASLAEPMSCIIAAFKASYHTPNGTSCHEMGIKEGGNLAILAGAGPMGLGSIDLALHGDRKPGLIVVTDMDEKKLSRARRLFGKAAKEAGVKVQFLNTANIGSSGLMELSGGRGYDDVFVFAPVREVVEYANAIIGPDCCLNFFAGPVDPGFSALTNYYNVHYAGTHILGTSGGDTQDMKDALRLMADGGLNPSVMLTHIGGLESVIGTTLNLPHIPGGKKMIYPHTDLPLIAIDQLKELGKQDARLGMLAEIVQEADGLWCKEAEAYLLGHF